VAGAQIRVPAGRGASTPAALTARGAVPPAAGFVNGAGSIDDTVRVRPRTKRGSHMLHMLRRMGMLRRE